VNCNTVGENPRCHTASQPALFSQPSLLPCFTSTNVKCTTLQAKNCIWPVLDVDPVLVLSYRNAIDLELSESHMTLVNPARIGMLGSEILLVELDVLHPLSKITSYMFVCYKPTNELLSLFTFWLSHEISR